MQSGGLLLGLLGCFLLAVATPASGAGYPDLPSAASNLITVPAGSMVIAMGNDQLSGGYFNFKSYGSSSSTFIPPSPNLISEAHVDSPRTHTGLAVYLLYEKIPVYWVIKAGKAKDAADFTANAYKVRHPPPPYHTRRQDRRHIIIARVRWCACVCSWAARPRRRLRSPLRVARL
jgi:hypothetical protein